MTTSWSFTNIILQTNILLLLSLWMKKAKTSCFHNRKKIWNNQYTCHIEIEIKILQTIEIVIELTTHFSYWNYNWNRFQNWNNTSVQTFARRHGHLIVPATKTFGSRSFRSAALTVWNSLLSILLDINRSRGQFARRIRTWLFGCAYTLEALLYYCSGTFKIY